MKTKGWEAIERVLWEYAQEQFGARAWDRGQHVKGGQKRIQKLAFELKVDGDGMLEKKAIVRAFLTSHYSDVDLKKLSKLQNWDMTALLNFWHARQKEGKCPTFLFKAWKNKDSEMVPSVVSSKSPSPATETIRKQKRAIHQSPQDSLTDAQSDTQETEEEADDDLADGRSPHKRARRVANLSRTHQKLTVPKSLPKPQQTKTANDNLEYVTQATRQHASGDQWKGKEVVVTQYSTSSVWYFWCDMVLDIWCSVPPGKKYQTPDVEY
ncbi:hypothetical protein BDR04DRAFT_1118144 [Suillus decipiens]|nr:hypothetical protein BDR04DRAFT_1118144 [Suillus decipiens]